MLKGLKHSWSQVKMCPPILCPFCHYCLCILRPNTILPDCFSKTIFCTLCLILTSVGQRIWGGGGIRPFCWPSQYFFKIQELKGEGDFLAQIYLATHMGYVQKIFECEKQKAYKKSRPRWCSTFIYLRWIVKLRIKNRE